MGNHLSKELSDNWGAVSPEDAEDDPLSPLLPAKNRPSRKSETPRCIPGESPELFAERMLFVCKHIAREARNEGANLYETDSSASPVKRRNCWRGSSPPPSPSKRLAVRIAARQPNYLWDPVYARQNPLITEETESSCAPAIEEDEESSCAPAIERESTSCAPAIEEETESSCAPSIDGWTREPTSIDGGDGL